MAVNYADAGAICQGGFVEEFVDAAGDEINVIGSTVEEATGFSDGFEVTVTLRRAGAAEVAPVPGGGPSMPVI